MAETRSAWVTGASSGIGQATSRLLLEQGYRVVGISRRGRVSEFEHEDFIPLALDLAQTDRIEPGVSELLEQYPPDCLVHAAGQGHFGSIEQFSLAQIENSIRLNLISALVLCRSLLPGMRRRGRGQLIFIGSESASSAGSKGALYSAAKFGLRGFCQALREDSASDGIRVSLINPGMVRSPFFDDLTFAPGAKAENAIEVGDVALVVCQLLQASNNIVVDEINLSPRVKSIDFGKKM